MISSRLKTWPGRSASSRSTWNSERVRLTGSPRIDDQVAGEVDPHRPRLDRLRPRRRARAVELAAAQLGADPAEQLADRERLGDVVVGADLEPDDLVDLGVLGGQQDDRHRAAGADVATDVEAAAAGHHDVEDQQVVPGLVVAELLVGVLTVDRERDVEALLLERVADRVAHRGLVVGDQDAPAAQAAITPPGSGPAWRPADGPRMCCPPPPTRPRSRRPSRRPSAWRSTGRGRIPPARASPSHGRSARRPGRLSSARSRCRCRSTSITTSSSSSARARIVTSPGAGVFLNAFVSRPISTWRSRILSPWATRSARTSSATSMPSGRRPPRRTPRPRADVERLGPALADRLHPRQRQQRLGQPADPLGVVGEPGEEVLAGLGVVLGPGAQDLDRA